MKEEEKERGERQGEGEANTEGAHSYWLYNSHDQAPTN